MLVCISKCICLHFQDKWLDGWLVGWLRCCGGWMGEWFACSKRSPRMHFDGRMYFSGADVFWKSEGIGRGSIFYHAQPLKFKLQLHRKTALLRSTGGDAVFRNYRPGRFSNWICYSGTRPKRSAPFQRVQPERSCGDLIVVLYPRTNRTTIPLQD